MKRRYLYVLLFAVPALLASIIASFAAFAAAAGALWLFVHGDDPWPASAGTVLVAVFAAVCVSSWAALLAVAYFAGRARESRPARDTRHAALAAGGATALLVLVVAAHQWRVGNIGPPSATVACAEICRGRGFSGSGMPPRDSGDTTCTCFDAQGREATSVPLEDVTAARRSSRQ